MRNRTWVYIFLLMVYFSCGNSSNSTKTDFISKENTTKKFFSQDGQFRILFEQEPTAYTKDVPNEDGSIRMNYFIYEKGINLIYCISYADYPESYFTNKVTEDVLQQLLVTYIDSQSAGLETSRQFTLGKWPGISFKASNSDTFVFGQYVLKNNRLFQLTVTKEGGYANEADANAFFSSLELM